MEDFTLKKQEKSQFITNVKVKDGTYILTFADGMEFHDIECTPENRKKIEAALEEQGTLGISRRKNFKLRKTLSGIVSGFSATMVASSVPFAAGMFKIGILDSTSCIIAGGSLILFGGIALLVSQNKRVENKNKLEQIDTLTFIENSQTRTDILEASTAPNGLTGVSFEGKRLFDKDDPFCLLDVDSMHVQDYRTILSNKSVLDTLASEGIKPTQYIKK